MDEILRDTLILIGILSGSGVGVYLLGGYIQRSKREEADDLQTILKDMEKTSDYNNLKVKDPYRINKL